jgi:hypothetical protein
VRIAVAGTIALSISFYDAVRRIFRGYPLMLMSLVPMFNLHVARQFIFSAAVNCVKWCCCRLFVAVAGDHDPGGVGSCT